MLPPAAIRTVSVLFPLLATTFVCTADQVLLPHLTLRVGTVVGLMALFWLIAGPHRETAQLCGERPPRGPSFAEANPLATGLTLGVLTLLAGGVEVAGAGFRLGDDAMYANTCALLGLTGLAMLGAGHVAAHRALGRSGLSAAPRHLPHTLRAPTPDEPDPPLQDRWGREVTDRHARRHVTDKR